MIRVYQGHHPIMKSRLKQEKPFNGLLEEKTDPLSVSRIHTDADTADQQMMFDAHPLT
jgi:hypothetical protein